MRQTIQISINKEIWAKADAEFHFRYGAAMSAWNSLERALYVWFVGITVSLR
jgi:hypothetical protein